MTAQSFLTSLQAYYGKMSPIHLKTLQDWLVEKRFSEHFLGVLYKEIIADHPTTYGKPVDLAIVRKYQLDLGARYREPVEQLNGHGQKMIGERTVSLEEGRKLLSDISARLAGKKRYCNSPAHAHGNLDNRGKV